MDQFSQTVLLGAASGGAAEPPAAPGQQLFEPSSAVITENFTWVCPDGVTSISVVCVGGGGGSVVVTSGHSGGPGGGLGYANNLTVVPGQSYSVQTGGSGRNQNDIGDASGGDSFFAEIGGSVSNAYVFASGAKQPDVTASPPYPSVVNPGTFGGTAVSGGGNGGVKGGLSGSYQGGGGGAGGYTGAGGAGGSGADANGFNGLGGGGGGGSTSPTASGQVDAAGGGGVGLLGQGVSGAGGLSSSSVGATGGRGGSGGDTGQDRLNVTPTGVDDPAADYGGGARSVSGQGGRGAVRIIWPGTTRQFPSTNTGDV